MEKNDSLNLHNAKQIQSLQNKPENIELLKAMRKTYSKGKVILGWLFVLNIGVVVVLAFLIWKLNDQKWNEFIAIYGVVITALDLFLLTPIMKAYFEKGATIQELFDNAVLGLKANPLKLTHSIDDIEIKQIASTYVDNPKAKLPDWYVLDNSLNPHDAVLAAQTMNLSWEKNQKKPWLKIINGLVLLTVVVIFSLLLFENPNFISMLAYALPAILPALVFGFQYRKNLISDIQTINNIESYVSRLNTLGTSEARQLQDEIFEYRKNNMPVFDWTYKKCRESLEKHFR